MKKIGIINVTSYSGIELLRILETHPEVEITQVTGRSMAGEKLSNVFSFYNGNSSTYSRKIHSQTRNVEKRVK